MITALQLERMRYRHQFTRANQIHIIQALRGRLAHISELRNRIDKRHPDGKRMYKRTNKSGTMPTIAELDEREKEIREEIKRVENGHLPKEFRFQRYRCDKQGDLY